MSLSFSLPSPGFAFFSLRMSCKNTQHCSRGEGKRFVVHVTLLEQVYIQGWVYMMNIASTQPPHQAGDGFELSKKTQAPLPLILTGLPRSRKSRSTAPLESIRKVPLRPSILMRMKSSLVKICRTDRNILQIPWLNLATGALKKLGFGSFEPPRSFLLSFSKRAKDSADTTSFLEI